MNSETTMKQISECFIKPKYEPNEANKPYYLSPMDLAMLSMHYIQKGLLFKKPSKLNHDQEFSIHKLKESLSLTLVHFYPLAGQFVTQVDDDHSLIFIDCNKGPGARFIHSTLDMTISDILSPTYVPVVVHSFFDHDRAVSHDAHSMSLLTVKVTELIDGVFIGCSINHAVVDGTSFWHFWNVWSEIHTSMGKDFVRICLESVKPLTVTSQHGLYSEIFMYSSRLKMVVGRAGSCQASGASPHGMGLTGPCP